MSSPPVALIEGRCPSRPGADLRGAALLGALALSFACVALDNTKLALAVPTLARELGSTAGVGLGVRWIVEANLVVYTALLLPGGALSERIGTRRASMLGLGLFMAGSCASAAAGSTLALFGARAVVGAGAALMTPASLAGIQQAFSGAARARAVAVWTAGFAAATALGPLIGGVLLERWGFGALMMSHVPLVALALCGVFTLLPARALPARPLAGRRAPGPVPLEPKQVSRALSSCRVRRTPLRGEGASNPARWGTLHSVLPPHLEKPGADFGFLLLGPLSSAPLRRALLVILLSYFAFSGLSFAIAQYWQVVRLHAPSAASLWNLPLPLAMLAGTLSAPLLMRRWGTSGALARSLAVALVGAALVGLAGALQSDLALCVALVPFAAGAGSAFPNATETIVSVAAPERAGTAAALSETAFELGGVLGIGALGMPFHSLVVGAPAPSGAAAWAGAAAALAFALALAIARGPSRSNGPSCSRGALRSVGQNAPSTRRAWSQALRRVLRLMP